MTNEIEVPGTMYNLVHGMNPLSVRLLAMLGLTIADFGRFRDTEFNRVVSNEGEYIGLRIVVLTRIGGNNRYDYHDTIALLRSHESYLDDADDDFDSTYARFLFFLKGKEPKTTVDRRMIDRI